MVAVIVAFALMFVLSFLGFPSRLVAEPSPFPSLSPSVSFPSSPLATGASGAPAASPSP
ncbi:MAG TPA: hypothetical protein VHK63_08895 [Candidatus Limnocylindria bacterium]|nr:hypothetical protein [Candidatus Limnocylindria bacterium]